MESFGTFLVHIWYRDRFVKIIIKMMTRFDYIKLIIIQNMYTFKLFSPFMAENLNPCTTRWLLFFSFRRSTISKIKLNIYSLRGIDLFSLHGFDNWFLYFEINSDLWFDAWVYNLKHHEGSSHLHGEKITTMIGYSSCVRHLI